MMGDRTTTPAELHLPWSLGPTHRSVQDDRGVRLATIDLPGPHARAIARAGHNLDLLRDILAVIEHSPEGAITIPEGSELHLEIIEAVQAAGGGA